MVNLLRALAPGLLLAATATAQHGSQHGSQGNAQGSSHGYTQGGSQGNSQANPQASSQASSQASAQASAHGNSQASSQASSHGSSQGGYYNPAEQYSGGPPNSEGSASPAYPLFAYPLPFPPNASPSMTVDGIDYYELTVQPFSKQVYPNLGAASLIGYNGIAPGPTFWVERYQQIVLRVQNQQSRNTTVHLHGSDTHSPWDGWADDFIAPGEFKDYYYPNDHQARSIWYHDHADHVTATNAYQGLGGVWIIHDPTEEALGLPANDYDVIMTVDDKTYNSDGELVIPSTEGQNQFGDVIQVNGQPWPYLEVEPRKYRFRIFDMSLSRPYEFYIAGENGDWIDFQVIASDCGLFGSPVTTNSVQISMGERYEIVFDFAPYKGQNLTMGNDMGTGPLGQIYTSDNTNKIMLFMVGSTVTDTSNNGAVPQTLNTNIQWPEATTEVSQTFDFQNGGDARWTINGVDYDDVNNRVLARPQQGTTELWEVKYAGGGPGVHPVHVHLISFQIVSRTGGSRGLLPYESAGLKDIVLLEPGETAQVLANYGPWNGLFMFHCHNLIHEDNAMMAVFNVTQLDNLGYNVTEDFADPQDARFTARPVASDSYDDAVISSTLSYLAALKAYDTTDSAATVTTSQTVSGTQTQMYAPTTSTQGTITTSYVSVSTAMVGMTSTVLATTVQVVSTMS